MEQRQTDGQRAEESLQPPASPTTDSLGGIIERWRERTAARHVARLLSPRSRRALARRLRQTADVARAHKPGAFRRHREPLLQLRVAAVRADLLAIAALLEHTNHPDPARLSALHELLAAGPDSPLHNASIDVSELHAVLDYVRSGL
jgi:hypothetical protein